MRLVFLLLFSMYSFNSFSSIDGINAEKIKIMITNENKELTQVESHLFTINKSKFGQKFIWGSWVEKSDGSIYGKGAINAGYSTESIITYFKISDDQNFVQLFEVKPNDQHPGIIVQDDLIDVFPVVRIGENEVTFDFAKGLPTRFLKSWINPEGALKIKILYSYIHSFLNTESEISFAQLLKLDDEQNSTMVLRHYFREQTPNPNFSPVYARNSWELGFLPVAFEEDKKIPIRKFDHSKTIVWYISSNTPDEYKESIREGILWWNNAFEREVIKVEFLNEPVAWASARINVFQWSEKDNFCGGGGAFGPSLSDPITGETFSAKVIFCGPSFKTFFDMYDDGSITWEEFAPKMYRWAAVHEVGHTLGLAHNFYAKLYRDPTNPKIITSSVMDYPNPFEAIKITDIGVRDYASIKFLYTNLDTSAALSNLQKYPICTDFQKMTDPDCNQFTRGGMNATELRDWLLNTLENSPSSFLPGDQTILRSIPKLIFTRDDKTTIIKFKRIMQRLGASESLWLTSAPYAAYTQPIFLTLSEQYRNYVFEELLKSFNELQSLKGKKAIIDIFSLYKNFQAFNKILSIEKIIKQNIETLSDPDKLEIAYRLNEHLKSVKENFWK